MVNNHAQLLRAENASRPAPSMSNSMGINGDGESEGGSAPGEDTNARDARDKERWAKLKKLRQVFHVKRGKSKGNGGNIGKLPEKEKGKENSVVGGLAA